MSQPERMAHDDPELRRRVREELLLVKPKAEPVVSASQLAGLVGLWRREGRSVGYLSQRYGVPVELIRQAAKDGER